MCVPLCSRSHDVVEYLLKEQWFIKCKDMAQKVIRAMERKDLKIIPDSHESTLYDFLDNIR